MMTSLMTRADPGLLTTTERRSRRAVLAMFAVDGFGFGAWAAHLPAFKAWLGLSDGGLSVPLFAMVAGSLVAMPMAGRFISRKGSRGVVLASACLYCLMLPLIALSVRVGWGMGLFALAALVFGAAKGRSTSRPMPRRWPSSATGRSRSCRAATAAGASVRSSARGRPHSP